MNRLKTSLFRKSNAVIRLLLSVLGFGAVYSLNSCEDNGAAEYGTPTATFKVMGTVKSEQTSNPVSNIRVVMGYDTTFTDESGNYQVSNVDFPDDQTFLLEFKDIDGETNGAYQPLDTMVEFTDPEFSGGSGAWDSGETEKEVNVNLKDTE